jgi:hypothetical protein
VGVRRHAPALLAAAFVLSWAWGAAGSSGTGAIVADHGAAGRIDWTRGLAVASGAAAADLRARTPEVARVGAERRARERALDKLEVLARDVPLADGRTVGEAIAGNEVAAARLSRALAEAIDVDIDYGTDGSVVASLGLPLEAIRLALRGPIEPPRGPGPTGVVVAAAGQLDAPALGFELRAGDESYAPPMVFARGAARADRRLGEEVVIARLHAAEGGTLVVDLAPEVLARARAAGALVVITL